MSRHALAADRAGRGAQTPLHAQRCRRLYRRCIPGGLHDFNQMSRRRERPLQPARQPVCPLFEVCGKSAGTLATVVV